MNNTCIECDYLLGCRKKLKVNGETVYAKEQDIYPMKCLCEAQELCRTCDHFWNQRCASWKVVNGKEVEHGRLHYCKSWRRSED